MPRLYNTDHQPHLIHPTSGERAVMPGESYDFTDEQIAAGLAGCWSDTDPREGLAGEQKFKRRRDTKASKATDPDDTSEGDSSDENTDPAETGDSQTSD